MPRSAQPTKKVFVRPPDNYYEMSDAEQEEVGLQMADFFIHELGLDKVKPKRKGAVKSNGRAT